MTESCQCTTGRWDELVYNIASTNKGGKGLISNACVHNNISNRYHDTSYVAERRRRTMKVRRIYWKGLFVNARVDHAHPRPLLMFRISSFIFYVSHV